MVPRFEKRVRAFAADISGIIVAYLLSFLGTFTLEDPLLINLIRILAMVIACFLIIVLPIMLRSGQSFGKRMQQIKIVKMDGSNASFWIILAREVFKFAASTLTFGIYLVVAYFTLTEKHVSRTIHDYIFGTKVIDLDNSPRNQKYNDAIRTQTMKDTDLR